MDVTIGLCRKVTTCWTPSRGWQGTELCSSWGLIWWELQDSEDEGVCMASELGLCYQRRHLPGHNAQPGLGTVPAPISGSWPCTALVGWDGCPFPPAAFKVMPPQTVHLTRCAPSPLSHAVSITPHSICLPPSMSVSPFRPPPPVSLSPR
ncbi:uncharacterized protein LOC142364931 isoform X3 [Opisthocomus hoazin]|uniref:uncharacterized protein LOC142364931 isoform X3 n=1 Tax=Opisthocomus hoazin TaxID=30419 RepID=UPI003F5368A4